MFTLRLKYKKENYMKFLSHLDMVRLMERTFRRADLPLEFSHGFNPHPKINFAMPLSVGVTSESEVMEVDITNKIDISEFIKNQKNFLPEGIEIISGIYVDSSKSLMSKVKASEFIITIKNFGNKLTDEELKLKLNSFLKNEEIIIKKINKKKKMTEKNIRPGILFFSFLGRKEESILLKVFVSSGSSFNVKAEDVLTKFFEFSQMVIDNSDIRIHRTKILRESGNGMVDIYLK